MKKITFISSLFVLIAASAWADIPTGYYANAIGKQDEALMTALEGIVFSHTLLGYDYMWIAYDVTDLGSDGYYIDMYSTCKYDNTAEHVAGASYVGEGINREHSFPKSWFGGEVSPMFTDLTMLIPTDAYVNQRRSNYPYGVCNGADAVTYTNDELGVTMLGKLGKSTYNGYTAKVFEPDDEYKGDFARIYFYMVTCYKSDVRNWPGCDQLDYVTNNYKAFSSWSIQMLMEWHRADPVSQKELNRNEAVYSEQGNRNPFVDHPELAEYIWGTKQNESWTGEGTPTDPLDKKVPIMLEVDTTAVKGHSFRADWTSGGDVSSYTLQVNRIETVEEPVLMMTENFSKVNASADGFNDISGTLDTYTDNPGWTGFKLYTAANHGIKFGSSSTVGYLVTPDLELASTITVKFNAKNWINNKGVSDNSSIIVSCGEESQTIALTDTPTDYTIVLTNCREHNVKFSMTSGGKRFYVYNVEVYNGDLIAYRAPRRVVVEEGDSTWRNVSGINDTCYTVKALAEGYYEYLVKAIYTDGTESVWSNIQHVTLTGIDDEPLLGDVNGDGEVSVGDVTALIDILLSGNEDLTDITAADMNGDSDVSIADVTALIDYLLSGSKE